MQDIFTKNYLDIIKNNARKRIYEITKEVFSDSLDINIEFKDGFEVTLFEKSYSTVYKGGIIYRNGKQTDVWTECSYDGYSNDNSVNKMHEDSANEYLTKQLIEVGKKYTQAGFQNFKVNVKNK